MEMGHWNPDVSGPIAAPLERCTELLGGDLDTLCALAAEVERDLRVDGTKVWSLMQLERRLRSEAYGRVRSKGWQRECFPRPRPRDSFSRDCKLRGLWASYPFSAITQGPRRFRRWAGCLGCRTHGGLHAPEALVEAAQVRLRSGAASVPLGIRRSVAMSAVSPGAAARRSRRGYSYQDGCALHAALTCSRVFGMKWHVRPTRTSLAGNIALLAAGIGKSRQWRTQDASGVQRCCASQMLGELSRLACSAGYSPPS